MSYEQVHNDNYAIKQTFKTRFWKHIWELDLESLRDLLEQGNPVGHVNFQFCVPSNHGYQFKQKYDGLWSEDSETHSGQNKAIDTYLNSHGKTAVAILWDMLVICENSTYELILPSGAMVVWDGQIEKMLLTLWFCGAECTNYRVKQYLIESDDLEIVPTDLVGVLMANFNGDSTGILKSFFEELFKRKNKCTIHPEHYQILLLCCPKYWNRYLETFPLKKLDYLFEWCKPSSYITQRLWKLRLCNLDPKRWPTVNDFDDISVEELKAMYEGHPNIFELEQDEPQAKKQKIDL